MTAVYFQCGQNYLNNYFIHIKLNIMTFKHKRTASEWIALVILGHVKEANSGYVGQCDGIWIWLMTEQPIC